MNSITDSGADDPFGDQLIEDMRWLGRLAARLVSDPGLADDACQEAWMKASAKESGPPSREELALGVRRFLMMHWRGSARRRAREHQSARKDLAPPVDQLLERRESQTRIWNELVGLKDPHRCTLLMRFQEGLSTREIAAGLGANQDTVRRHLREGVAQLRAKLAADREGGGLAGILAAIPASLREAGAVATPGARAGLHGLGLKAGVALVALGVSAMLVVRLLTDPVQRPAGPLTLTADALETPASPVTILDPVSPEDRLELGAPRAKAASAGAAAAAAPSAGSTVAAPRRGQDPFEVRVFLRTIDHVELPKRVAIVLEGTDDGGTPLATVRGERDVIEGYVDISFADSDSHMFTMTNSGQVTVTAKGFGTQTCFPFDLNWESPLPPSVELFLYPTTTFPVRVVSAETRQPIQGARLSIRGGDAEVSGRLKTNADGVAILPLIATSAGRPGAVEEHLFVHGKGVAVGHWTRSELEQLPLQRDGTRVLELAQPIAVEGRIALESGGSLPEGAVISYSMDRSRQQTPIDFPHWVEPRGQVRVDESGHFRIDGLAKGLLILRAKASRDHDALALGPDFMVDIDDGSHRALDLVVPTDPTVVTLHLEWHSPKQILFLRLYEIDPTDGPYLSGLTPRKLLARCSSFSVLKNVPILLPKGALREGANYLLEVGPNYDNFLERTIVFHGDAPRLEHSFAPVMLSECPYTVGSTPEELLRSHEARALARKKGARTILHARTE